MHSCPPARTEFSLLKLLWNSIFTKDISLEEQMAKQLGAPKVLIADAWVKMLAEGLNALAVGQHKDEIILPAYSCNEFTKAILLAGLRPIYANLDEQCRLPVRSVQKCYSRKTLAVLNVNNTGVTSDLRTLRKWCDHQGCLMIEDAGYTFLGTDSEGKAYGSFGHAAIINLSEGKTIPCGGAAWVINDPALLPYFAELEKKIANKKPKSNMAEFISMVIYLMGSSRAGYIVYRKQKSWFGGDLKAFFTSEPSRQKENYTTGNLVVKDDNIRLEADHAVALQMARLRPWNIVRQQCAWLIMQDTESIRQIRQQRLLWWKEQMGNTFNLLPLPDNGMPVKQPFLLPVDLFTDKILDQMAWAGVKKQYPVSWPMYPLSESHDKHFYEQMFTLPLHGGVSKRHCRKVEEMLRKKRNG